MHALEFKSLEELNKFLHSFDNKGANIKNISLAKCIQGEEIIYTVILISDTTPLDKENLNGYI